MRRDPEPQVIEKPAVQRLIDAVELPLAVADAHGHIVLVNHAFLAVGGWTLSEVLHQPAAEFLLWSGGDGQPRSAPTSFPLTWQSRGTGQQPGAAGTTTRLGDDASALMLLQLVRPPSPEEIPPSSQRVWRVQDVAVGLAEAVTVQDVTDVMLREAGAALGSAGLLVTLIDGDGLLSPVRIEGYGPKMRELIRQRVRDVDGAPMQAVRQRKALVYSSPEAYLASFPRREEMVQASGMQSWVYVPLIASGRVVGTWSVSYSERYAIPPADLAQLTTLAALCAQTLERARLYEREHEMASVLQRAIAPDELPMLNGVGFAARYVPATVGSVVGGDFFDVFPLPGGRALVVLGDVVGHDIRSAALMGQVRATLRAYAVAGGGPAKILEQTNRVLALRSAQIVTCCCLELDANNGTVTIARAGHLPPLLLRASGEAALLELPGGLALGSRETEEYPETTMSLGVGDLLLLYTDGLVESRVRPLDQGLAQLVDAASGSGIRTPGALVDHILEALAPASHADDIALLAIQRRPPASPSPDVIEVDGPS